MRKRRGKIIAAALVLLLIGGFAFRDSIVRLYVRLNSGTLEEFALASLEGCGEEHLSAQYGPWNTTAWKRAEAVEFCVQQSFAFGGVEKGFYYAKDDAPISFNAVDTPLVEADGGWRWEVHGNHGTTRRILPHWFWYEAVL